ncbi:hypothetical protein MUA26_00690 [Staphylococcus sp. IVB6246]|uniref:four-carbon acid sugar kinase family protein n=1 Tax=Staphylococcus sp. IVB6246 TaxID=2989772 RepID=UPI0021D3C2FD|nr:four-carbon acid sugar kinase family protein [Staphylococcus sp. IVB6246]UXR69715.1 hypothetical protein MUA26_00690 [Staphylococcus sp. IVB6246]
MLNRQLIEQQQGDEIRKGLDTLNFKIVVLDDDPTGTQTVKDLPVYTDFSLQYIEDGFQQPHNMFYILTNSRALTETETTTLHTTIIENIEAISQKLDVPYMVISRGDSTLRGHFYLEPKVLNDAADEPFDAVFYLPAFFEGNRFTYEGVHYLEDNGALMPVADSEFANDTTFGFKSTTMADFIDEKSNGEIKSDNVKHITLQQLRNRENLFDVFAQLSNFDAVVVDALNDEDMDYFVASLIAFLNQQPKRFIFRTAASFVKAICQTPGEIIQLNDYQQSGHGGLMIVGSHVKKSSDQLQHLLSNTDIEAVEFGVKILETPDLLEGYIQDLTQRVEKLLSEGKDVALYTSRDVVKTNDINQNLNISTQISNSLVQIVQDLAIQPSFIIAKGGITSSDVATKGLGIKKAEVIGQVTAGVPVWLTGEEAKYAGMPYVIFPGNVGDVETLTNVYEINKTRKNT